MSQPKTIQIDDVEYVRADSVQKGPRGPRAVVVVDKGWVFAGDVKDENGRVYLSNAVWVFKWQSVGFAKVIEDPKGSKADIRKIADVDIPAGAEVFRIGVAGDWGF